MLQCILTTLGTLAALYAIKEIHKYIWIDRVPREEYEQQKSWRDHYEQKSEKLWEAERKASRSESEAIERADQLAKSLLTQNERINSILKSMTNGPVRTRLENILNGQTPKL